MGLPRGRAGTVARRRHPPSARVIGGPSGRRPDDGPESLPPPLGVAVRTRSGLEDQSTPESGRIRVLEVLRNAPGELGVTDLAAQLDLHANTVRFHLSR